MNVEVNQWYSKWKKTKRKCKKKIYIFL